MKNLRFLWLRWLGGAKCNFALLLLLAACWLPSCASPRKAAGPPADPTGLEVPDELEAGSVHSPDVIRLEKGVEVPTKDGPYTPGEDESWFPERILQRLLY